MDNTASLTAQQLRYSLGSRRLINDVSLSINSGEMVAIIGPNGAGKSTLLRLLTGYLTPGCGECQLLGQTAGTVATTAVGESARGHAST